MAAMPFRNSAATGGGINNALGTLNTALAAQIWPEVVSFLRDSVR